jgi:hypothetical protein
MEAAIHVAMNGGFLHRYVTETPNERVRFYLEVRGLPSRSDPQECW